MTRNDVKRFPTIATLAIGLVIISFGYLGFDPASRVKEIFVGAGASVVASAIVLIIFFNRDSLAHRVMQYGVVKLFHDRHVELPKEFWSELLNGARHYVRILGVANHGYLNMAGGALKEEERNALSAVLQRERVIVTILWLDPRSGIAEQRDEEEERGTRLDTIESIAAFSQFRGSLPENIRGRMELKVYTATPTFGITWVDNSMVVTNYLPETPNQHSPGLVLTYSRIEKALKMIERDFAAMYEVYSANFKAIDEVSTPVTPELLAELGNFGKKLPPEPSEADFRTNDCADRAEIVSVPAAA